MSDRSSSWLSTAAYAVGLGVGVPVAAFVMTPFVLGTATMALHTIRRHRNGGRNTKDEKEPSSSLLTGQVWHTRFRPTRHSFTYPLFMFGIDLDEEETFNRRLWPLSLIMSFSARHHLINGEGGGDTDNSLRERVYSLVRERTLDRCAPTAETHRVVLVTHLSYYGYCFNPVSFYYILPRGRILSDDQYKLDAVVAEVSNTPWLEMYPYVLHADSSDRVDAIAWPTERIVNYRFPKKFHVSPFMEMNYTYDWLFEGGVQHERGTPDVSSSSSSTAPDTLRVTTAMKTPEGIPQFTATMRLRPVGLHPYTLAWQITRYPAYCLIIQVWIHYQAFWLFWKGVAYQAHPQDAETLASRLIGAAMTPFFTLQEWWSSAK
jgi:DUF1365 family protein